MKKKEQKTEPAKQNVYGVSFFLYSSRQEISQQSLQGDYLQSISG